MGESLGLVVILVVLIAMMWFANRGQKKKRQEAQAFRGNLKVGDSVMTSSGLLGEIDQIDEVTNSVIVSSEGSKSRWIVDAITKRPNSALETTALNQSDEKTEIEANDEANNDVDSETDAETPEK